MKRLFFKFGGLQLLSVLAFLSFALNVHAAGSNPLIFVHGGAGSASQFSSQAMRFTSNGYEQSQLFSLEYDSSFNVDTIPGVHQRLDALIAEVQSPTGSEKVDVMGHSLGTYVLQTYLASPVRAANIGHYINIDGYPAASLPGNVPTLAIWAGIGNGGHIVGGTNVTIEGQTHVEVATSAQAFAHMFEFLTGNEPKTTDIKKAKRHHVSISGRAVLFPLNVGVDGADLEIYEVNPNTGQRIKAKPHASFSIDQTGNWGPFKAHQGRYYEFVIVREGQDHHIYRQPFIHDDHFVRLLTSEVGGGVGGNIDVSDQQTNLIISRDRELWGDQEFGNDLILINGQNVVNEGNSPLSNRTTGLYMNDMGSDGISDLEFPDPYLHSIPFLSGNDYFIPASPDASGKIRVNMIDRGFAGQMQEFNIPDWPSTNHRVTLHFNDYVQGDSRPTQHAKGKYFKKKHH